MSGNIRIINLQAFLNSNQLPKCGPHNLQIQLHPAPRLGGAHSRSASTFCELCEINFSSPSKLLYHKKGFFHKKLNIFKNEFGKEHWQQGAKIIRTGLITSHSKKYLLEESENERFCTSSEDSLDGTIVADIGNTQHEGRGVHQSKEACINNKTNLCDRRKLEKIEHSSIENSKHDKMGKDIVLLQQIKGEFKKIIDSVCLHRNMPPSTALIYLRHFRKNFEDKKKERRP
ncbi:uncharacterized protein LOC132708078 [Cylas formicarius]|uniref:uncharacterized protein LOC132708078 n=1 Tax=Cylas formicarius TaxID=197179 RepID=UPI00295862E6|nr:uncharacterized protein LOC132708078 [Cylas formicarius]